MKLKLFYKILKHDPRGHLTKDSGLIPSHSYVIQFLELIEALLGRRDKDATDVDGAESVLVDASDNISTKGRVDAGAGNDTYGIVIGTNAGATAEDNENYALDTKIEHSAVGEADKMNYQAVTFVVPTESAGNIDFDITRSFLNETVGTITVKEIGIICKNTTDTKYHLLLRDVVDDEDVVADFTLTVVYTLRTTV